MKVSFIVPVYNCESYLENCIQSICQISNYNWELILVDDGSKDKSGEICNNYARQNPNIKVYHQENQGPSVARNKGIELATGDYIRFADCDDEVLPAEEVFHQDADLWIFEAQLIDKDSQCLRMITVGKSRTCTRRELLQEMDRTNKAAFLHYIWNKIYKTRIIKENRIRFDKSISLGEDFSFNCMYLSYCEKIILSEVMGYSYFYRNIDSLTQKFINDEIVRRKKLDTQLLQLYKCSDLYKEPYIERIQRFMGFAAFNSLQSIEKPNCRLTFVDKCRYVSSFVNSEYRECILSALLEDQKSLKIGQKIQLLMIQMKCSWGLVAYHEAYNRIKGWKR